MTVEKGPKNKTKQTTKTPKSILNPVLSFKGTLGNPTIVLGSLDSIADWRTVEMRESLALICLKKWKL